MRSQPHPTRGAAPVLFLALCAAVLATGCARSSEATKFQGREIVIFVDFSESIRGDNLSLFEEDLRKSIVPSLSAGDRLVLAPINDRTLTAFHPLVEITFPPEPDFDGWRDNLLKYKQEVKKVEDEVTRLRREADDKISKILKIRSKSQRTDVFSSLLMARKLFDHAPRQKVLVLMSDMIQDYPPYRFDRIAWGPAKNEDILAELGAKGMIPNLSGVCVYVSGISGDSAEQAAHIAAFWSDYFDRTQADMDASRYAHVLLHWPPSKSCASSKT